ncbi:NAC domain protein (macronuclear) [Tetrahymena thermophila SB210]|uniref:NAC domain protein n=1 Tax=Tetrahymena thermophila (strain SB210) TaxID=312017 RepID=I7LVJ1_TETTS|nr:NAC domain protein [Tetrahymena thermophila SB210]EAR98331.2 NAC domain protein [Tetrahymena thermophila SB210]|eukprot:XP_001018576.2 NAC domain protein [Tetrahymena thermophila SB210]
MTDAEQKLHDHEHVHGEDCDHDHDHEHDHDDSDSDDEKGDKKANRGEKKFKKAMAKLGMKSVEGINRVTIRKGKNLLLYIDNPDVMKSPGAENSYIIFGEAKINDFAQNLAASEAEKFNSKAPTQAPKTETTAETTEEAEGDLDETGLDAESIKMVMEHGKCTKAKAIKALRETEGDAVTAIIKVQE